jgi:hypothetical protein
MDPSTIAQLLSGIFTGGAGLAQLGQAGSSAAAGASAADPFASQRGSYQNMLSGLFSAVQGQQAGTNSNLGSVWNSLLGTNTNVGTSAYSQQGAQNTNALMYLSQLMAGQNTNTATGATTAMTNSASNLHSQINQLSSNYMDNPAIKAQYNLGLQAAQAGIQASGTSASGAQLKQLSDYGQQFASSAYQQQFTNLLNSNQQEYNQNLSNVQLNNSAAGQNLTQTLSGLTSAANVQSQALQGDLSLEGLNMQGQQESIANRLSALTSAGSLMGTNSSLLLNSTQGLLNSALTASGASTGSPSTAGAILSGQFANTQTALGNLGSGITALGSGLSSFSGGSGIGSLLNSLFSSGTSGGVSSFLSGLSGGDSVGDLATSLGSSTSGGLDALMAGGADTGASEGLSALFGI